MKYKKWLNEWLQQYVKPTTKIRTFERYQNLTVHIASKIGEYDIKDLTSFILQKCVGDLLKNGNIKTGKGLSANTVNAIISLIQSSLKAAYTIGITDKYFANNIKRPKACEKTIECFSISEQKAIEQAILNGKKPKMIGVVICLYMGLRIGELLALEWSDIDFQNGIMTISKSCHYGKNERGKQERIIETPKTQNSVRIIPIPKNLIPVLRKYKKSSDSPYVVSERGKPVSVRSYQRSFELLQKRLKLQHRGFHSLRHTFATRALECGMDVKTLSEILGHINPNITLKRYAHSMLDHKKEMMNRIGKLL